MLQSEVSDLLLGKVSVSVVGGDRGLFFFVLPIKCLLFFATHIHKLGTVIVFLLRGPVLEAIQVVCIGEGEWPIWLRARREGGAKGGNASLRLHQAFLSKRRAGGDTERERGRRER